QSKTVAQIELGEAIGRDLIGEDGHDEHRCDPADGHDDRDGNIGPAQPPCGGGLHRNIGHAAASLLRSRGSSRPYRKSTIRFEVTIVIATSSRMHCTTARSRLATATTNSRPTPGHENTLSTTTAPAIRLPTMKPRMVTVGIAAFGSAWSVITRRHGTPLADAVRI